MQLDGVGGIEIGLQQVQHLGVAVLLHHIDAFMAGHELRDLLGEREGPDAQVVGR